MPHASPPPRRNPGRGAGRLPTLTPGRKPLACTVVATAIALGLVVLLALHFLEPPLAVTWSYAHLARHPALPWCGAGLVVLLPLATSRWWHRAATGRPPGRLRPVTVAAAGVGLAVVLVAVGQLWPPRPVSLDPVALVIAVRENRMDNARWHLLIWAFRQLWALAQPLGWEAGAFLRAVNGVLGAVALVALAGAARRLAATRGEAVAITLLVGSALGILQLTVGYLDVYPAVLAIAALYAWTALRVLRGEGHPAWPALAAALGPFFYVGLVLLWPSFGVVALVVARRPGGGRRLAVATALALAVAGLATLPGYGRPFAWTAWASDLGRDSLRQYGLSTTSSILPLAHLIGFTHLREVVHTLVLVDGVGAWLCVVAGTWLVVAREGDAPSVFLGALVAATLAYLLAMDPLWGAFSDWDLFSWGAITTGLLGAYAFVRWGRHCPRAFAPLLGLALATAGVHLLARLDALAVELVRHQAESPFHLH